MRKGGGREGEGARQKERGEGGLVGEEGRMGGEAVGGREGGKERKGGREGWSIVLRITCVAVEWRGRLE